MNPVFDHRDPGADETAWAARIVRSDLTVLDLDVDRLVVIAAHPDDETLGAGGLMARCTTLGVPIQVVIATDGEAADGAGAEAARARRKESVDALDEVAPGARLTFLGLPDGRLRDHRTALAEALRRLFGTDQRTLVVTTWTEDGHPDHAALGGVVRSVAPLSARVLAAPIWFWHWADPTSVDLGGWIALALRPEEREAKRRSIARHTSQLSTRGAETAPIIHPSMRSHFERDVEIFVPLRGWSADTDTDTDTASVSTARFDERFTKDPDPWGFRTRWYERRKRDLLLASLPAARFEAALEVGCAIGVLTHAIAARATSTLGIDASPAAIERARSDAAAADGLRFACRRVPDEWPDGTFDLIVLSEILYYLGPLDRRRVLEQIGRTLRLGGVVVACHWRHDIADAPSDGDTVHAELAEGLQLPRMLRLVDEDIVLEVFGDRPSPARAEGLV